ncbi:MAG: 2-oxo-4-hydroxy-4-carboxy-5-ureidoimidazoline decarboxylase [Actinomycetota bacterium]|nr:2-oxo-4-hydroxy-4-carboxy-5-ureidoimidazoline decarboxylase [Actinomycetota bacterium]
MITLQELNTLNESEFVTLIGPIFEASPWIAKRTWPNRPFHDLDSLHDSLCRSMHRAREQEKLALIRAHPDLAGRAARQGSLTPESTAEQAGAGLDRLTDEELASFSRMNQKYRARFGFPFVICVGEHTKESILASFATRLENDRGKETETALAEVCKIARLRLHDLVATPAEDRS